VAETCGTEVVVDTWLLDAVGCDALCAVVVKAVESCGCAEDEANDITGFCAVVDSSIFAAYSVVVAVVAVRAVFETGGTMDVAAVDMWLLDVADCDVIICVVVVVPIGH